MSKLPRGVEKVIALAALDGDFKRKLLTDRGKALAECDIELTDTEAGLLRSIPEKQLAAAIDNTRVPSKARRLFLIGGVGAAISVVIGVIALKMILRSPDPEKTAIGRMRTLSNAQLRYRNKYGRYATIKELREEGLIDSELSSGHVDGYSFLLTNLSTSE